MPMPGNDSTHLMVPLLLRIAIALERIAEAIEHRPFPDRPR